MIKISQLKLGYSVTKNHQNVAVIRKASIDELSDWGNWILEHANGRKDRHHYLESAKSDALKI